MTLGSISFSTGTLPRRSEGIHGRVCSRSKGKSGVVGPAEPSTTGVIPAVGKGVPGAAFSSTGNAIETASAVFVSAFISTAASPSPGRFQGRVFSRAKGKSGGFVPDKTGPAKVGALRCVAGRPTRRSAVWAEGNGGGI